MEPEILKHVDQRDSETTMTLPGSWSNTGLSIPQKTSQTEIMQEANIGGDNDRLSILDQPRSSDDQTFVDLPNCADETPSTDIGLTSDDATTIHQPNLDDQLLVSTAKDQHTLYAYNGI
jgi:hypothetical protein